MMQMVATATETNWVDVTTAWATVAAFVVAALALVSSARTAARAQPRLVFATTEAVEKQVKYDGALPQTAQTFGLDRRPNNTTLGNSFHPEAVMVTARVHNQSTELIGPVKVEVINTLTGKYVDGVRAEIKFIKPEEDVDLPLVFPDQWSGSDPQGIIRIIFRDASGRWWQRLETDPVRWAPSQILDSTSSREQIARGLHWKRSARPPRPSDEEIITKALEGPRAS